MRGSASPSDLEPTPLPESLAPSSERFDVRLAVALAVGMCTGSLTSYVLAVLAPYVIDDFGLSRARFGGLSTMLFIAAAVGSPVAGRLSDRFGGKRLLLSTFVLFSAGIIGLSSATSYGMLAVAIIFGGAALATMNPATNHLVASRTAGRERGWMTGIKQSGAQLSAVIAGILLPSAAILVGWRVALLGLVIFATAGFVFTWRAILPDRLVSEHPGSIGARQPSSVREPLPHSVWWLAVYAWAMAAGSGAVLFYIPLYVFEEFSVSVAVAGAATGVVGVVGTVARVLWGPLSQRFASVSLPLGILALLSAVAVALMWIAPRAGIGLLWVGVVIYGLSAAAWNTVAMLGVITMTGGHQTGRASGIVLVSSFVGGILSPVLFGYAVDVTGSYSAGWTAVLSLFALAALVSRHWHTEHPPTPVATGHASEREDR